MLLELPNFEYTFALDVKGEESGKRYIGEFTYKRPNLRQSSEIAKFKTRLDGDLTNLDTSISMLHQMLSQLRFCLIKYPDWWSESDFGLDLYDCNVIIELYKEAMDFEKKFDKKIASKVEKTTSKDKEKDE